VIPDGLAPPPTVVGARTIVAAELVSLEGSLRFDVAAARATAHVVVTLTTGATGHPAFDLRQNLGAASLDGEAIAPASLAHVDLGGGPGAEMRVLNRPVVAGERHRLELEYDLVSPAVEDPRPIAWGQATVGFDAWCSDLLPARYLEQWLPVGLCQDRFALSLDIELVGAGPEHRLIANASVDRLDEHRWRVAWPAHHTSLSSMLVIAPAASLEAATTETSQGTTVELTAERAPAGDEARRGPDALAGQVGDWLEANAARIGPYLHGDRFTAHVWNSSRGMEYDGATTGSVHALEHEVFHSWFGRGVKPASANDGWIDEAITTWCTADGGNDRPPRLSAAAFPLDEPPVLLCPLSPWSRFTPSASYSTGFRLFADLAHRGGGADAVLDALATFFSVNAGGFVSTAGLEAHLAATLGVEVAPWWDRYVRGRP
jgi:hypothetical protein